MTIKILSVHTSTKHSQSFLSQQEMFLQLSAIQFLALLLQENTESFVTLKPVYHMIYILWGSLELAYKSPSNLNSWF
jgi:hypothetical protein